MPSPEPFFAAARFSSGTVAGPDAYLAFTGAALLLGTLWLALRLGPRRRHKTQDMDYLPGPWKQALPLLGNVLSLLRLDVHRQLLAWADEHGGVFRAKMLWHDGIVVTDPAALAQICGRGEGACDKASSFYHAIDGMTSSTHQPNLLTSPADSTWHTIRKAVAQSFAFNNVKRKLPLILERVDAMIARLHALGPNAPVDMDGMALRVTLDVIGAAGWGFSYSSVEQPLPAPKGHLLRILPRCFYECMLRIVNPYRAVSPLFAPLKSKGVLGWGRQGQQCFKEFQNKMSELMDAVSSRGPPSDTDTDLGTQLWRLVYEGKVSKERALSEIGILFVEGFETTGHTISWTLLQVVTHPGTQDKIAAELESIGLLVKPGDPCPPRRLELEDLKSLRYLTACVKEAMRMFPVVSIMSRVTHGNTRIGPYLIPGGTPVVIPLFAIHNTRHNWLHPDKFLPERWMDVPVETYVAGPGTIGGTVSSSSGSGGGSGNGTSGSGTGASGGGSVVGGSGDGGGKGTIGGTVSSSGGNGGGSGSGDGSIGAGSGRGTRSSDGSGACGGDGSGGKGGSGIGNSGSGIRIGGGGIGNGGSGGSHSEGLGSGASDGRSSIGGSRSGSGVSGSDCGICASSSVSSVSSGVGNGGGSLHDVGSSGKGSGNAATAATTTAAATVNSAATTTHAGSGNSSAAAAAAAAAARTICFMPFSEGPRNCVGQTLAKLEVMVVLASIFASFRLRLAPEMGGVEGVRQREGTLLTLQTWGAQGIAFNLRPRGEEAQGAEAAAEA